MRGHHLDSGAGLAGLTIRDHPDPVPGAGQVVVAVRAASLSFQELMIARGDAGSRRLPPLRLG
ncbi:hypothetical protein [Microbispora sp. GKU 823]|uniref:hypothetical protein n=1 Tax=Microbispora sp. GKU 823 TaxID=1652100 RepID=UPI0009A44D37|nr:hypothetical protein [Microbispora sp. GKU 823]OPG04709.1 hypothetical protein B1L11_37140 [Microbispora sp. GKU 823]